MVRVVLARGGRIEGRARRRDGRPFEDGRVAATSLSSRGGGFEPVPTLADGAYVLDHVPSGRVLVTLMTRVGSHPFMSGPPGMVALAGVAGREAEVREGETATVDLATREVVVAGRVTRGGQGLPGVTVTVMSRDASAMSATMTSSPTAFTPPAGPPPLSATTREDGSYELVVFTPGKAYVQMRSPERQAFPGREVDVPDAERYELDLEVGGASVAGAVADKDTGAPVPEAQISLRLPGPDGEWKGGAASGPDGRFTITAEPGEYEIVASALGRRPARMPLSVGAGGVSDLRIEMEAGLEMKGRVVDASLRPVPDVFVVAVDPDTGPVRSTRQGPSLPDGTFRLGGLEAKAYTLLAGGFGGEVGYSMRAGVTPGEEPVTLVLRPGGRATVRVLGPDGAPVKDVWPHIASWDGAKAAGLPGVDSRPADAPGVYEMGLPAGTVGIEAGSGAKPLGGATVRVSAGQAASVDLVLRERPAR